jgi:hypothetical protein
MADNVVANAGAGGATFRTDDDGTAHWPYTKLAWGADNTQTVVAAGAGSIPIQDGGNSITIDVAAAIAVDGSGVTQPVSHAALTELAGAINASAQMDVNIAASAATVAVSNAGLTELAAAINVSSQMDVNLAASSATVTVSATNLDIRDLTSASDSVAAVCTNAGTFAVQVDGSALTALQLIDNPVVVDDAAFTPATTSVMMAGFEADETATDSVDEGDGGAARMTLDRKVIVTPQPHTAGGLSISRDIDLDNGTLTVVKASAGQLYGWWITNTSTVTVFVKFYDAASGTLGTGTPVLTIGIPGNATDDTLALANMGGMGIAFATGICVGAGTGVADADNTDPGANAVVANILYK